MVQSNTMWHLPESLQDLAEGGENGIVWELLDSFQNDTASRLERLHDGVARLAAATVKAEAHSIRGSARQMGAGELADLCQVIESCPPEMDWPEQENRVCQAELRFAEVCSAMTAYASAKRAG